MKKQLPLAVKIIRRFFITVVEFLMLPFYTLIGIIPRDKNVWIFCSWFGQRYSDNSRLFFEYVNKNHPEIKTVWLSKNKGIVKKLRADRNKAFGSYSFYGIFCLLRAGKVFSTTGGEIPLFFCNGVEYYALWHGMPLKKILFDDKYSGGGLGQSEFRKKMAKILQKIFRWKSFLTQKNIHTVTNSEFFVEFLKTAFSLPDEKILRTGSPRCDALFAHRKEALIEKIRGQFPGEKIILYMPTFRTAEWTGQVFNPFDEKYGFDLDEFLATLTRHKSVLVYKPHFYDARFMQTVRQKADGTLLRFLTVSDSDYDELYNFVGQTDILMTDYSSIYFDFIATGKPVVLLPFDYDFYIRNARGHYFDYFENMEGVKAKNWQEFYRILEMQSYCPVSEETQKKFAEFVDGRCCEKLWEKLVF